MRNDSQAKSLTSLLVIAGLGLGALLIGLPWLAVTIDRASAAFEQHLVQATLIRGQTDYMARLDDAARRGPSAGELPVSLDGPQMAAYAFATDGRIVAARAGGPEIARLPRDKLRAAAAPLLARLRREATAQPTAAGESPPVVHGVVAEVIDGRVYGMVASLAEPDPHAVTRRPALMFIWDFEKGVIPRLHDDLRQENAHVVLGAKPPPGESLPLLDEASHPVAYLAWRPYSPGSTPLIQAGVPIVLGMCGLVAAFVFAYGRSRTSAKALVESERRAHHLAFHDQLTELANRRLLTEHLAQALARAGRHGGEVAVMLIDLDRFKFVNDTYGHGCGDELLKEVARRLCEASRADDVVARLGGDEFVILATPCGAADAAAVAQRVLLSLAEPVRLSAATVHTAGSVGISIYAGGPATPDDLLRQADLALYRVKEHGRNNFCFFETEMDQALQSRRRLEADLRHALAEGAIGVVYQPQFQNDEITGVEALARWTHPERGPIGPAFFVALAEECGLMEELGRHVIARVFDDSWRWPKLRIAINLSPVQLRTPAFLTHLQLLVETTGVEPERFEFELTERVLLADDIQTQHALAALRGMGFGLALDDFGTGYSSLSYLRRFPVDRIKIDRSFVAGLGEDKVSDSVVRAVVRLGRALEMDVMAEGVETLEQRRRLAAVGCRSVQGFLTGRPVEADEVLAQVPVTRAA